jgi:hypothetical protein
LVSNSLFGHFFDAKMIRAATGDPIPISIRRSLTGCGERAGDMERADRDNADAKRSAPALAAPHNAQADHEFLVDLVRAARMLRFHGIPDREVSDGWAETAAPGADAARWLLWF